MKSLFIYRYRILIVSLLLINMVGCKKDCVCEGLKGNLGDLVCEEFKENSARELIINIQAEPFSRAGDDYFSVYFEASSRRKDGGEVDPVYGYGKFLSYETAAWFQGGKVPIYHQSYTKIFFHIINFGNHVDKNEMLRYGVPENMLSDKHWSIEDE